MKLDSCSKENLKMKSSYKGLAMRINSSHKNLITLALKCKRWIGVLGWN